MTANLTLSRIRAALTTPPVFPAGAPKPKTNLDTNFLKLIAIIAMLIDHIGGVFFPEVGWFRWIGRLAFPIFCYCMTVGLLYTRNIKKYLFRLGLFAVISQPFYVLAFHPHDFVAEFTNWNIFFTLFLSLLAMWGLTTRRWWLFVLGVLVLAFGSFDYNYNGVILMLIFYFCRNKPALLAGLYTLFWIPALWGGSLEDPLALVVGGHAVNWTIFGLLALPLILCRTHSGIRIPKWFFYAFYPAHVYLLFGGSVLLYNALAL